MGLHCLFRIRFTSIHSESPEKREEKIKKDARRIHSRTSRNICGTQIRSYVRITTKSHSCPISSPLSLSFSPLPSPLSLMQQNFPLMSNSRIDFHIVPFLSLFFLYLLFTAHTIIAFVPLRSLVVLNFHVSAPRRRKNRGRRERRNAHLSIPRQGSNVVLPLVRKKDPRKKRACALACLPARN